MDTKTIDKVNQQVYKQFPEALGKKPKIRTQKTANIHQIEENYLLTYQCTANGPGGKSIQRVIRVVASGNGSIKKMTTSR